MIMSFTLQQAIQYVHETVLKRKASDPPEKRPIVFDDATIEKPWGWIFFYNNERYYRTRDPFDAHVGAGPLFFNSSTGDIRSFGSGCNVNQEIYDYEMDLASVGKYWTLWLTDDQERTAVILKIKQLFNLTTARARDYVPVLPLPFFYGIRRNMDWLSCRCHEIDVKTDIKLESSQPTCREFVLPNDVVNPTASEAFHRQWSA